MAKKFRIKKIVKHAVREYITIVDDQDAHLLRSFFWSVIDGGHARDTPYVGRHHGGQLIILHRMIMKAGSGQLVWHINGDTMDNQRQNLLIREVPEEVE